jgi:hypothetical protein
MWLQTGGELQLAPWRFIVFEGEARRSAGEAIAAAFRAKYPDAKPEHIEAERERLVRAPLVIAVVSRAGPHVKIPEWDGPSLKDRCQAVATSPDFSNALHVHQN